MISILQHQMNKQRFKFASSFSFQETFSVHRSSSTPPLYNRHHYHQSSQVRFSRLHKHPIHLSNISPFYSLPIITRLFTSSSPSNNENDNDTNVEITTVSQQRPMENLYREWTLEQDQLLWSKSNSSSSNNNNNKKNSNDAAELAVLLGRGTRGVQQRLLKLKDVNSSAYQRLFVETQNNNSGKSKGNEKERDSNNNDKNNNNNNKLVPALEIVRRIEWDYQLNENDFYIMHYDRVDNVVVTTQLTATNNQIDSEETLFIKALPEHRIVAIKYLERIVWDRRQQRKYDIFFTEPGIISVINAYDDWKRNRDEQLKVKRAIQKAWNIRWIYLLGEGKSSETNKKVDRLMKLTKDLLRSAINTNSMDNNRSNDNYDDNSEDAITNSNTNADLPSTSPTVITMMMKQQIDFYLRSIKGLFNEKDLFSSSSVPTPTLIEENSNNEERVLLLLNELSEWAASPYWFQSILSSIDDDNNEIENNNEEVGGDNDNEYSRLLREILLQKISSIMDRLEGTDKNKLVVGKEIHKSIRSKKKQKIVQQQEASNRLASIEIKDKDIEEKFIRGSGSGGQKINKTSSCVSLLHKPTSIRVECQDSRSLDQNRKTARKRLKEKLDLYYNGSQSKQSMKQQDMKKKKQKKKSKNKSRVKEKQLKEHTQNQTSQTEKKKLSKKQQLLLQLVEGKEKEEADEIEGRKRK